MFQRIEEEIKNIIINTYSFLEKNNLDKLIIDTPPEKFIDKFDFSTNIALVLSKELNEKPFDIATKIVSSLSKVEFIETCEVIAPAFINFKVKDKFIIQMINDILQHGDKNLIKNIGNGEKVNVEFCSANPTGPLHIGHARGTIFGDTLANLLSKSGYDVCREYYINDAGGQIDKLEKSIQWRLDGKADPMPDGYYSGEYIKNIAEMRRDILKNDKNKKWNKIETANDIINVMIIPTLKTLKVDYNQWTSEQKLKDEGAIEKSIQHLTDLGLIYRGILEPPKGKVIEDYEPREQLLFKSSQFGDDIDRPLAKNDGSHTYFASDIAYHYDKWRRGFNNMVVVLGADHKGYVKRLTSAVKAISNNQGDVHVKLCELVNFMKNGEIVKMSKRKNNFLTIDDVLEEIDVDILRFIILTRKADTVLNFDLEKAKEQSKDNPIWYIQYANARCRSLLDKAQSMNIALSNYVEENLKLSNDLHKMIVKMCFYTRFIELSIKNYEPYFFANYLIQLANEFHSLYEKEKFIEESDAMMSSYKLAIIKSIQILIKDALSIFKINVIKRM